MVLLLSSLLSVLLLASPNAEISDSKHVTVQSALAAQTTTFIINNQTSAVVGTVTIHLADQTDEYINVTGSGLYSTNIDSAPTVCIINGQGLVQYAQTAIWLDEHNGVRMTWTQSIILVDQTLTR